MTAVVALTGWPSGTVGKGAAISPVYSATGLVAYLILRWPWF
jgi:hypothetical protein